MTSEQKLAEVTQKIRDVKNIFITGKNMNDEVLMIGAHQKLTQLVKEQRDLKAQLMNEDAFAGINAVEVSGPGARAGEELDEMFADQGAGSGATGAEDERAPIRRVGVTVLDLNSPNVTSRTDSIQKIIRIKDADDEEEALSRAKAFYKKQGYKVLDAWYIGELEESIGSTVKKAGAALKKTFTDPVGQANDELGDTEGNKKKFWTKEVGQKKTEPGRSIKEDESDGYEHAPGECKQCDADRALAAKKSRDPRTGNDKPLQKGMKNWPDHQDANVEANRKKLSGEVDEMTAPQATRLASLKNRVAPKDKAPMDLVAKKSNSGGGSAPRRMAEDTHRKVGNLDSVGNLPPTVSAQPGDLLITHKGPIGVYVGNGKIKSDQEQHHNLLLCKPLESVFVKEDATQKELQTARLKEDANVEANRKKLSDRVDEDDISSNQQSRLVKKYKDAGLGATGSANRLDKFKGKHGYKSEPTDSVTSQLKKDRDAGISMGSAYDRASKSKVREDASAGATGSASVAAVVTSTPGIIKRTGNKKATKGLYANSVTPRTFTNAIGQGIYESDEAKTKEKFSFDDWKKSGKPAKTGVRKDGTPSKELDAGVHDNEKKMRKNGVKEGMFDRFKKTPKPQMMPVTPEQRNFIKQFFPSSNADIKCGKDGSAYVLPDNVNAQFGKGRAHFRNEGGQLMVSVEHYRNSDDMGNRTQSPITHTEHVINGPADMQKVQSLIAEGKINEWDNGPNGTYDDKINHAKVRHLGKGIPSDEEVAKRKAEKEAEVRMRREPLAKAPRIKAAPKPKVRKEPKPRIPRFKTDEAITPLEIKAQQAMFKVWSDIAADLMMSGESSYEEYENPYMVAEVCTDANRLQTNAGLSPQEEREILDNLSDKTLARLCSRFGI